MDINKFLFCISLGLVLWSDQAYASCHDYPQVVADYLGAHPAWSIVSVDELNGTDRALWEETEESICPGFVEIVLDDSGQSSYALLLWQKADGQFMQQLVVIRQGAGRIRTYVLEKPFKASRAAVLRKVRPGVYAEFYLGRKVRVEYNAIALEFMQQRVTLYSLLHNLFFKLLISD